MTNASALRMEIAARLLAVSKVNNQLMGRQNIIAQPLHGSPVPQLATPGTSLTRGAVVRSVPLAT